MPVTVYRSTDASAPVLSGTAGAMVGVLDACLVTGYGAKAAAGWATEFTGTNLRVYRAPSGIRHRLRIDDTTTTSCRAAGFEVMTDVNTGTKQYPLDSQVTGVGVYWLKSDTASAAARPWIVIANNKHVIVFTNLNDSKILPLNSYQCFGDTIPLRGNDSHNSVIIGATGTTCSNTLARGYAASIYQYMPILGHYMARASNGIAGSQPLGKVCSYLNQANQTTSVPMGMGNSTAIDFAGNSTLMYCPTYPIPTTSGYLLEPALLTDWSGLRAQLPGLYNIGHRNAYDAFGGHGDQFAGTGIYDGKTFEIWRYTVSGSVSSGAVAVEVSDTWQI